MLNYAYGHEYDKLLAVNCFPGKSPSQMSGPETLK